MHQISIALYFGKLKPHNSITEAISNHQPTLNTQDNSF